MPGSETRVKVCICLGSSCFSRGSNESLKTLQQYISDHNLENVVSITGSLCEGRCKEGPNVVINSDRHVGVTPGSLIDLVKFYIDKTEEKG
ncbi:MAG: (2Fe-2S) ferredoxin domain-containing protein [Sedimentisphaerales bacterium]|nr:(2Fe-2S) ferredoxin domain-containing protein [Sedimentisphaerales bacterium]